MACQGLHPGCDEPLDTTDPCSDCYLTEHALAHPDYVEGCATCRLLTVELSPAATPSKTRRVGSLGSRNRNSWERGIPTDNRGMPVLREDGSPMRAKEYAERRREIDESRRRARISTGG